MNRQISQVALVALVLLASLIVATTYWQTWASAGLAAREDNEIQRVAEFSIDRGLIYSSNGKTVLAANVEKKVGGQTLFFRTYPNHGLASQVVGYSTQSRARAGLERSENSYLTGANADLGTILATVGDRLKGTTIKGNNLVLTIHAGAQWLAEKLLRGTCGAAVVLNPKTGAVDVMASSPGFDPNLIEQASGYAKVEATKSPCPPEPAAPLLNRATQGLYPPGSTFKTITAAAALDDGVYTPNSTFYDPGYCTEYGKQVHNALDQTGPEAFGLVNLVEAYQHSINAVFCNIGQKLGAARILAEAKKFGFYSVPPLETPADARSASGLYANGKLFDPKTAAQLSQVDPGRLAFGQDRMLATPLQMALVAAAVAGQRRPDEADADPEDRRPRRVGDREPEAAGPASGDLAEDRGRAQEHDGRGRAGGHRDGGADPGRGRRRQDRHRRDLLVQHRLRRLVHLLRPGREPDRGGRGRRRRPEQRFRRGDRRSDRQAADAGDPSLDDESEHGKPWPLTSKTA